MKQVLTAQIAHKYAGCMVKRPLVGGGLKITEIDIKHSEFTLMNNDGDHFHASISDCQPILWRLEDIRDEDAIEIAKIIMPLVFQKYKSGWKVVRNFAITGWPYLRVTHEKNIYSFEIDCKLVNFTVLNMGEPITQETPMPYVQLVDFLRASEHNGKPKPAYDLDGLIGSCAVDGKLLTF